MELRLIENETIKILEAREHEACHSIECIRKVCDEAEALGVPIYAINIEEDDDYTTVWAFVPVQRPGDDMKQEKPCDECKAIVSETGHFSDCPYIK